MLQKEFFQVQPFNPNPYWEGTVLVNLSGAQKFEQNTVFFPGRYRIEVAPGRSMVAGEQLNAPQTGVANMNHIENIRVPFLVRAYCGGNATTSSPGVNLYSGPFKVNAVQNPSRVAGIDVNHIFGAGGGNVCFGQGFSDQVLMGGGGNCLGNGASAPQPYSGTMFSGAGSCLHIMPVDGIFGTNYLRAYHTCSTSPGGGNGSAYGGAGTGPGPNQGFANNWFTRGGNSLYGTGAVTESSSGTGVGNGIGWQFNLDSVPRIGAGAYFNGTIWVDEPGNSTNTGSSYIRITYLGPVS